MVQIPRALEYTFSLVLMDVRLILGTLGGIFRPKCQHILFRLVDSKHYYIILTIFVVPSPGVLFGMTHVLFKQNTKPVADPVGVHRAIPPWPTIENAEFGC